MAEGRVPPRSRGLVLLFNLLGQNEPDELRQAVLQLAEIGAASRYPDDDVEHGDAAGARVYEAAARSVLGQVVEMLEQPGDSVAGC